MKPSELLSGPDAWMKGDYACDANGESVDWTSETAVRFCIRGAFRHLREPNESFERVKESITKLFPGRDWSIMGFNDHPDATFEDVQKVLKEAGL